MEYKPFEYGNLPLRADGRARSGVFRLMLPPDADWSFPDKKAKAKKEEEEDPDSPSRKKSKKKKKK